MFGRAGETMFSRLLVPATDDFGDAVDVVEDASQFSLSL